MVNELKRAFVFCIIMAAVAACKKKTADEDATQGAAGSTSSNSQTETDDDTDAENLGQSVIELTAPANFSDSIRGLSLTQSPLLEWDSVSGATSYEIAIGSSAGAVDVLNWQDVGNVTSTVATGLTLENGAMYYASVRAVNATATTQPVSNGDGWQNLECPSGYIKVPGNVTVGLGGSVYLEGTKSRYDWDNHPTVATERAIADFCVMKYEAKLAASHTAVSTAAGTPWVNIARVTGGADNDAIEACANNGEDYELIANHHWQAIARSISANEVNYDTSGAEANYMFNYGNAENGGGSILAADADDANGCAGMGVNGLADPSTADDDCGGGWHINRRTHVLENDEVIWDFAGNVWEWVRDINPGSQIASDDYIQAVPYADALVWGPSASYTAQTGARKAGLGHFWDGTWGGMIRGGVYDNAAGAAGIYSVSLDVGEGTTAGSFGFRCVFTP